EAVSEAWRDFFEDYRPRSADRSASGNGSGAPSETMTAPIREPEAPPNGRASQPAAAASQEPAETASAGAGAMALTGAAAAIAKHMETSLSVPTATSVRTVPAKLLEVNRRQLNRYLATQ